MNFFRRVETQKKALKNMKNDNRCIFDEINKDNRGLSLVEVVCAVAIFALITSAIGMVLVMTSRSYKNGATETEVQQEAQFAANRIGGIIQDATEVTYDGAAKVLTMESGKNKYVVTHKTDTQELYYEAIVETESGTDTSGQQLLAHNIAEFSANADDFEKAKTVKLDMTVAEEGREYKLSYNMVARNEAVTEISSAGVRTASIIVEDKIIMVPGETYTLPVTVRGTTMGINASSSGASVSCGMDYVTITIPTDAIGNTENKIFVNIHTNETEDSSPLASTQVTVQVRRINQMKVEHSFNGANGEKNMAGAEYTFYSRIASATPYLAKSVGVAWEDGYKNPRAATWSYSFTINGAAANFSEYFEVLNKVEDADTPSITFKLKKDMVTGSKLTVTSTSKHAAGENKASSAYATVQAQDNIIPEVTRLSGDRVIALEPSQEATLDIEMKGAVSELVCDVTGKTSSATTILYSNADKKLKIKLGTDETGDSSGNIYVSVHPTGSTSTAVNVVIKVRRVKSITLQYKIIPQYDHGHLKQYTSYQFYTLFKGSNLYKTEGVEEYGEEYINAFTIKFNWKFEINGKEISGTSGTAIWNDYNHPNQTIVYPELKGNKYFKVIDLGNNNQQPCINFSLQQDMPKNAELKVEAVAMHPIGTNKTGNAYGNAEASCTLEGEKTVDLEITEDDIVIVEPGEGADEKGEHELAIPVYVTGTIYDLKADIENSQKSDSNTFVYGTEKFSDELWYVRLHIGKDERGKDNKGKMKLKLSAIGGEGEVATEYTPTLCLRRVTQVELIATDPISNTAGELITLEAKATGYGNGGTEYFARQMKDCGGNEPKWDRNYVSPYPMKWSLVVDNKEKELSQCTDYLSVQETTTGDGVQAITFKLVKPLPSGALLKATSKHATGTNKSGKLYEDVYDTISISGSEPELIDIGFSRGTDNTIPVNFQNHRSEYDSKQGVQRVFFRYREIGKEWSQYYRTVESSETFAKINASETYLFLPDKEYELEVITAVYNLNTKEIYWPHDASILDAGKGFAELGFTQGWDAGEEVTDKTEYMGRFYIGKTSVYFKENATWGVAEGDRTFGSYNETNPVNLVTGNSLSVEIDTKYFHLGNGQSRFKARIQQKIDGKWTDVTNSGWNLQTSCPTYLIDNIQSYASGLYRIGVAINNANWKSVSGTVFEPVYTTFSLDTDLYDFSDGTGVVYFKLN